MEHLRQLEYVQIIQQVSPKAKGLTGESPGFSLVTIIETFGKKRVKHFVPEKYVVASVRSIEKSDSY
jgi:hypothetical protein